MAEKKTAKYTSKGERPSVSPRHKVKCGLIDSMHHKYDAYLAGKKVYFTIPNPDPNKTNQRMIRVEGRALFGDPRSQIYRIMQ